MLSPSSFTLVNPQNGNLAFKLFCFDDNGFFDHMQRQNYYSLIWIKEGSGMAKANLDTYAFEAGSLFAFAPYQPFMFEAGEQIRGIAIYFHPDFFCIHKHHKEISGNGLLYNNVYQPPFVKVDEASAPTFDMLCQNIKAEMQHPALAQHELLVSYLKIFLISAARLKTAQQPAVATTNDTKEPFILQKLKDAIEANFKTRHAPSEYAALLYISPKALAKITKSYFNKTLSHLINERIIIEAKRELYLTDKTIKEIAADLGYEDEYYFSRFFKVNTDVSPQLYRDTVGYARA